MPDVPVVLRCRNCDRFVAASETVGKYYCSTECARHYLRCINCGSYFPSTGGGAVSYCSSDCAALYHVQLDNRILQLMEEEL